MSSRSKFAQYIVHEIVGIAASLILRSINISIRWTRLGLDGTLTREDGPCIFMFWHNRQLMGSFLYRMLGTISRAPGVALISQHGDGRMVSRAMYHLRGVSAAA